VIEAVGIIVPARNEEALIEPCLTALDLARARVAASIDTFVVLVLDACSDRTRAIAAGRLAGPHHLLEVDFANVGRARAAGVEHVFRHFHDRDPSRVWLATTDADSRVGDDWIGAHIAAADSGADALAGTVVVDDWSEHTVAQAQAFTRFYATGTTDSGTHPHVHGANFGVRGDAYRQAGGFAAHASGEDHALWNALRRSGRHTVASHRLAVTTSARRRARVPNGFAHFLAEHGRIVT
jgi:cellulose synthase/poly-beta-1,6-N-acetylglucosamine synthase-like glycosyltransferase